MTSPHSKFDRIELAAALPGGGFERNHWVRVGDTGALDAWRDRHDNTDVYASVCRFRDEDRDKRYRCPFFVDIDCKDLGEARHDTLKLCDLLIDHLGLESGSLDIYFSGQKGFHVLVPLRAFEDLDYEHLLDLWRALARRLVREGVGHIDQDVYDRARLLRLAGSIHAGTGLYKTPLEYKELRDSEMKDILELAKAPREELSMALPEPSPKAGGWGQEAVAWNENRRKERAKRKKQTSLFRRGWRMPPCVQTLEKVRLPDGLRHSAYYVLARWYAYVDMHPREAEKRLRKIDERHPIRDPHYIRRVVGNGRKHAGFAGCKHEVLCLYCQPEECFLKEVRENRRAKAVARPADQP